LGLRSERIEGRLNIPLSYRLISDLQHYLTGRG
jgi:hypothetical protein